MSDSASSDSQIIFNVPEGTVRIEKRRCYSGDEPVAAIPVKVAVLTLPDSVTEIGAEAFRACSLLTSVNIPGSVTKIGERAFQLCKSLALIEIPDSVTEIGDGAFYGCYSLTGIVIPSSVREIGREAFMCCTSLTEAKIPDTVRVKKCDFMGTPILTDIKAAEDEYSGGRVMLSLYWDLNVLGAIFGYFISALRMCESGQFVPIPKEISKTCVSIKNCIKENYCLECYSAFKNSEEAIEATKNFKNNLGFFGPEIPESIDSTQFYISTMNALSSHTFLFCPSVLAGLLLILKMTNAILKKEIVAIPEGAIKVNDDNPVFHDEDGVLFGGTVLRSYPAGRNMQKYDVPDFVTKIGHDAFMGCSSLIEVGIPASVTEVGKNAFSECSSLKKVYAPEDLDLLDAGIPDYAEIIRY